MKLSNRILAAISILIGVYLLISGARLKLFVQVTPGPGFLPFCCGCLLIIIGLCMMITSFGKNTDDRPSPFQKDELIHLAVISGTSVGVLVLTPVLGISVPIGLMVGAIMWLTGEKDLKKIIALTVLTPLAFYVVFSVGLGVYLPVGTFKM